ncbi:MAG: hypothetical protein KGI73_00070 [Patescibacteria group bacterium]|nr:hypothetical protein [Patescibacteria group bacterium]
MMENWLYSSKTRKSELNGDIIVTRRLGAWTVEVDGTYQTSSYTNEMWEDVVERAATERGIQSVARVLLIGLGGGGAVGAVARRFPGAEVTAIEHDPTMVDIAKDIKLHKPGAFPNVIVAEAGAAIPKLTERYDLIIVDIFSGKNLAPEVSEDAFWNALKARLAPGGIVSVNVSGHRDAMRLIAQQFPSGSIWKFRRNTLGAFW